MNLFAAITGGHTRAVTTVVGCMSCPLVRPYENPKMHLGRYPIRASFLDEFGEDAVAGFGMDEGDPPAVEPGAGRLVDQAEIGGFQTRTRISQRAALWAMLPPRRSTA